MKPVCLEDLKGKSKKELLAHIISEYSATATELRCVDILLAYESVGAWGCDSSSYFILRDKTTKQLFTVHASHCSCYGFENQWRPEPVSAAQLKLEKSPMLCGGYDDHEEENKQAVADFIKRLR